MLDVFIGIGIGVFSTVLTATILNMIAAFKYNKKAKKIRASRQSYESLSPTK